MKPGSLPLGPLAAVWGMGLVPLGLPEALLRLNS